MNIFIRILQFAIIIGAVAIFTSFFYFYSLKEILALAVITGLASLSSVLILSVFQIEKRLPTRI
jgi:5-bromo-4-chloroindolyl phosphate hydrolysis protein